jgi:hypothetical protein
MATFTPSNGVRELFGTAAPDLFINNSAAAFEPDDFIGFDKLLLDPDIVAGSTIN